jgi:hypothetical protein
LRYHALKQKQQGITMKFLLYVALAVVLAAPAQAVTVDAIEYHHASFDHYFITTVPAEINLLDARQPPFQDWSRTGYSFKVYQAASAPLGAVATCRFFNDHFAPKSSHFYAAHGFGCEATLAQFPDWKLEDAALFQHDAAERRRYLPG